MTEKIEDNQKTMKFLIIGDSGVGKSCMMMRYVQNAFTTAFYTTIGVDFKVKKATIDDQKIKMQIWDTAGQQRFRNVISNYYKGAHGIIMMYDVTNYESFRNITFWMEEVQKFSKENVVKILVGNKCDMQKNMKVRYVEAQNFARAHGMQFSEISVLESKGITQSFELVARKVLKSNNSNQDEARSVSKTSLKTQTQNRIIITGCCY